MDNSLRVIARIIARPDKVDEVRALLKGLIAPTRAEPGCLVYELLQNRSDPTDFTFVEKWASEAALEAHALSEHLRDVAVRLAPLISERSHLRRYFVVSDDDLVE